MREFSIITDTSCDLEPAILESLDVSTVLLGCERTDTDSNSDGFDLSAAEFYKEMREGAMFKTFAANPATFTDVFEKELQAGRDVLYMSISSALTSSPGFAAMAAEDLMEEYPDSTIITIDSKSASLGLGFLITLAVAKKRSGASVTETADYVREMIPHMCHWFTVDDLMFLKRGGRLNAAAAITGTILNIKPVLHMDDEGCLTPVSKVRGRKLAIKAMAENFDKFLADPNETTYYISHGDCLEDALALEALVEKSAGHKAVAINNIGATIGAHSGPGTLALFFIGTHR